MGPQPGKQPEEMSSSCCREDTDLMMHCGSKVKCTEF